MYDDTMLMHGVGVYLLWFSRLKKLCMAIFPVSSIVHRLQ